MTSSEDAKRQNFSQGSHSASSEEFEALDRQMRSQLLRVAWVIVRDWSLAADAVQAAFLTLHQKWGEVLPENRPGWLVKAAQYSAHNIRRSQYSHDKLPQLLWSRSPSTPSKFENKDEALEELGKLLDELPEDQRQIVQLRLVEGLTFQQIADRLAIPLGTALSRMRLAIDKIRSKVSDRAHE